MADKDIAVVESVQEVDMHICAEEDNPTNVDIFCLFLATSFSITSHQYPVYGIGGYKYGWAA
jgi:hypothetical protein